MNMAQVLAIAVFVLGVASFWFVVKASGTHGPGMTRLLLIQFLLLTCLIFSVLTKPSTNPQGLMAGIAAMIAVSRDGVSVCPFASGAGDAEVDTANCIARVWDQSPFWLMQENGLKRVRANSGRKARALEN